MLCAVFGILLCAWSARTLAAGSGYNEGALCQIPKITLGLSQGVNLSLAQSPGLAQTHVLV